MFLGQGFDFNDDGVNDAYVFGRVRPIILPKWCYRVFWCGVAAVAVVLYWHHLQTKHLQRLSQIENAQHIAASDARFLVDGASGRNGLELRLVGILPDVAQELGKYKNNLSLPEVEGIDVESARSLSAVDGLYLNGLKDISAEVAIALAQTKGFLSLDGLVSCSEDVATALARHRSRHRNPAGELHLNGLDTLSDEAAKSLAKHEGGLSLLGLTKLSEEAAAALLSNPNNRLNARFQR